MKNHYRDSCCMMHKWPRRLSSSSSSSPSSSPRTSIIPQLLTAISEYVPASHIFSPVTRPYALSPFSDCCRACWQGGREADG
mmetsp:Transcript_4947/g.6531  ORF Transcript_4947/g.6531 Transcript_4947/m.6531 type:complete len:82 (-) Transcript_4947:622-867(-)